MYSKMPVLWGSINLHLKAECHLVKINVVSLSVISPVSKYNTNKNTCDPKTFSNSCCLFIFIIMNWILPKPGTKTRTQLLL